ncbi:MAG: hypothetical protein M1823_007137 [Watsoniomyces obsoletus]|nr:MAG: hypothetical protein M1823_007137 [Watsoniomyces obsoletus]
MKIAEAGNGLIQAHRLDNALIASEPKLSAAVVGTVINLIYLCSAVFEPYLPATCESIRKQLQSPFLNIPSEEDIKPGWLPTYISPGHNLGKAEYLFSRIDEKKAEEWREYFGGNQADRIKKEKEEAEAAAKRAAQKEKAKAKKAEKKAKEKDGAGGVERSAKGGEDMDKANEANGEVKEVVDGVAQVTLPTS